MIAKVGILLCLIFLLRLNFVQDGYLDVQKKHQVTISSVKSYEDFSLLEGNINNLKYSLQYSGSHTFFIGEQYDVVLTQILNKNGDIPYTFDIKEFDQSTNIKGRYKIVEMSFIKRRFHINQISYRIDRYMKNQLPSSYGYVKTMVLADNDDLDEDILHAIRDTGISHLFAVSGLHIGMLVLLLKNGLKKIIKSEIVRDSILAIFLVFYMVITSFSPSVMRASLMVMFLFVSHYAKLHLDTLDIVSLVFIVLLLIHPYFYLQLGFQLSFLMTFFIVLARPLLSSEDKIQSVFALSMLAFFASLPFTLSMNQSINLLTIFWNVIYLFFVMFILLPMSYLTFCFPFLDSLYDIIITIFETSILFVSRIDFLVFRFVMNRLLYIVIYYILFIGLLIQFEQKKVHTRWVLLGIAFMVFIGFQGKLSMYHKVHFVDVYGDATIVQSSFDRCNILIDTGTNDSYDGLITYMKNQHIKRIDYFIVSHYHEDHFGELDDVFLSFDVKHYIDKTSVEQYQDLVTCGDIEFFFYPMKRNHHNENDNSIVMSLFMENDHYLFTGDIEAGVEEELITTYEFSSVDKLKVAHHGSITSSSEQFIEEIHPKEAFVMVALKNTHNHPSEIVIERYLTRGIDVYRTDQLGTIEIRYLFGKEWKKTSK
jgi:competence protein ComEC